MAIEGDRLQKAQAEECVYFLVYSIVCLCCSPAIRDIRCTSVARYSLFVLKVPLHINNKPNRIFSLLCRKTRNKLNNYGLSSIDHGLICISFASYARPYVLRFISLKKVDYVVFGTRGSCIVMQSWLSNVAM